jgi:hypothetical protein
VEYDDYQAERARILAAWGTEITDPEELAAAVDRLRRLAVTVEGDELRAKAIRYLTSLETLVAEARSPASETIDRAWDVMQRASAPDGTPAERRARALAGMQEIGRIADSAATAGERDAALELNGSLNEIVDLIDLDSAES